MEWGRHGVAVISGLGDGAAGFADAGIIDGHAQQRAAAIVQGLFKQRGEQRLSVPLGAGMEEVVRRPAVLLAAIGPDDPREGGAAQYQQAAQGLMLSARQEAGLDKHAAPARGEVKEGFKEHYWASGSRPKVFFSGREKRSLRARSEEHTSELQ